MSVLTGNEELNFLSFLFGFTDIIEIKLIFSMVHVTETVFPKYFLYCENLHVALYAIVNRSEQIFEQMCSMYGSNNCHLLQINSRAMDQMDVHLPDPWTQFLIQRASIDP